MDLKLIVAVDENWAIGKNGGLLVSIPKDMKFFKDTTTGGAVIMGRKTLESFPGGRPLKNRINLVLSRSGKAVKGAEVYKDIPALLERVKEISDREVFVIGGESVYKALLPYCSTAYVTKIDYAYDADTYFPNLDEDPAWTCLGESEEQIYFDLSYVFTRYQRKEKL